ncbi:DNA-J related domain-containing protein [Marinomonas pollencensis]|uniref:DnaJ-like protein n=1 Tax=Marinomonas pollencensis TaxID=491954 RepID=A0A3E0DID1_9GAMM|nr:DNA-J related domain-containing protein [Marinomonas pollencensis]REG82378.1 DnaJ-like protein [Marinomonas pollencensis]
MRNPLIGPILHILREHPEGVGEFEILKTLKQQLPELQDIAVDINLQLFRQHFLIMNALYQLQTSLWQEESLTLSISATHIRILSTKQVPSSSSNEVNNSVEAKLAAYYLDWNEYEKTDEQEVSRLLNSFYQGIYLTGDREAALETLQLNQKSPTKAEIKRQYRKLAHYAHPDHGGDTERFISLRQAYECLMF